MRTRIFLITVLLAGLVAPVHPGPLRVASINLCTDQLLLALADRAQIASITFLAQHAESSYMADRAHGHHFNHGQAEELVAIEPDVVVASSYLSPTKLRFLNDLGYRIELFRLAASIDEVYANIEQMAALLGHPERGTLLIGQMQDHLGPVLRNHSNQPSPSGAIYEPNGYTGGLDTLRGDILHQSGWRNVATDAGIKGVGVLDLEALLLLDPDRLIMSPYAPGTHSLGQRLLQHPAVKKITTARPPVVIPLKYWICGGAMNAEAVAQLAEARNTP